MMNESKVKVIQPGECLGIQVEPVDPQEEDFNMLPELKSSYFQQFSANKSEFAAVQFRLLKHVEGTTTFNA